MLREAIIWQNHIKKIPVFLLVNKQQDCLFLITYLFVVETSSKQLFSLLVKKRTILHEMSENTEIILQCRVIIVFIAGHCHNSW